MQIILPTSAHTSLNNAILKLFNMQISLVHTSHYERKFQSQGLYSGLITSSSCLYEPQQRELSIVNTMALWVKWFSRVTLLKHSTFNMPLHLRSMTDLNQTRFLQKVIVITADFPLFLLSCMLSLKEEDSFSSTNRNSCVL